MESVEVIEIIQNGESSKVQFKERIEDAQKFSQELVAFSNSQGGIIIIGVNDKNGDIRGLSFDEIRKTNEIIDNASTNNVKESIVVHTETLKINNQTVIIIKVDEGINKPYSDKNGIIWIKNGSSKRRVVSHFERARLFQESKFLFADETPIHNTSSSDIEIEYFKKFYFKKFNKNFDDEIISFEQSLENQQLLKNKCLTLAGLLMFCKNRDSFKPQFSIQCFSVNSTHLLGNHFEDNEPAFLGNLYEVFNQAMQFIDRNIKKVPSGDSFNSPLQWQIPRIVFEEVIVNALIHRDYYINTTVKIFMFIDRIEIISPGKLPNSQTEKTIVNGISIPRNLVLQSLAQYMLPYRGAGTGLLRIFENYKDIQLENKINNEQFVVTIYKPKTAQ